MMMVIDGHARLWPGMGYIMIVDHGQRSLINISWWLMVADSG